MEKFTTHQGLVVPLDIANIDTDQMIPKQFLQKTERVGFGVHLFHDWRYLDANELIENPKFILNAPKFKGASILVAGENFGCGSSREHAPWALQDFGFKVVIASSFADIFYGNCINIGLVPVKLTEQAVEQLIKKAKLGELTLNVDLINNKVISDSNSYDFCLDEFHQYCLEEGIDSVAWTLKKLETIINYEKNIPSWR